jgi:hypothetical protein
MSMDIVISEYLSALTLRKASSYTVCSESLCAHIKGVVSDVHNTGLNQFNFICKQFLQICVRKVTVTYKSCWK